MSAVPPRKSFNGELTLTQKQTAKTGQLSRRLYHMPISFVCLESESAGPREGETTMEKKESRRRDRRLIILKLSARLSGELGGIRRQTS
jgi:aminopeptidase N